MSPRQALALAIKLSRAAGKLDAEQGASVAACEARGIVSRAVDELVASVDGALARPRKRGVAK